MQGLVAQWVERTLSTSCRLEALPLKVWVFPGPSCFPFRRLLVFAFFCFVFILSLSFRGCLCSLSAIGPFSPLASEKTPAWITTLCPPLGKVWCSFKKYENLWDQNNEIHGISHYHSNLLRRSGIFQPSRQRRDSRLPQTRQRALANNRQVQHCKVQRLLNWPQQFPHWYRPKYLKLTSSEVHSHLWKGSEQPVAKNNQLG